LIADYDNDGNIDIFCANCGPNGLYHKIDREGKIAPWQRQGIAFPGAKSGAQRHLYRARGMD
jgi:hypothetical protein